MKQIIIPLLLSIILIGCCKDTPPEYNPSANFKMYEPGVPVWRYYWERIDRDTFLGGFIIFEALDTTKGISYEWQIGAENIKGQRSVGRDFSNVADKTNIEIELRVYYPNKKSDTLVRKFNITKSTSFPTIFNKSNWIFINDNDNKDTLRFRYFRSPNGSSYDTIFIDDCKRYVDGGLVNYTSYDLGLFSTLEGHSLIPCSKNTSLRDVFISLDNGNKNKATLRAKKINSNTSIQLTSYTGYTIH
jgi:hypothetical protein